MNVQWTTIFKNDFRFIEAVKVIAIKSWLWLPQEKGKINVQRGNWPSDSLGEWSGSSEKLYKDEKVSLPIFL